MDKDKKFKKLTRAEEQIMQKMWEMDEAVVKDIVDRFDDPKPAYTTVATVMKVLEKKGFVSHKIEGNTHLFKPEISRTEYTKQQLSNLLVNYFNGSFPKMATFFARENDLSIKELEEIIKQTEEELRNEKSDEQ